MSRWPLTARGTGAVLLAALCIVVAHAAKITELLYVAVLLLTVVAASLATLYVVRRSAQVGRSFSPDVASVGHDVEVGLNVEIRSVLPGAQGRWRDALPSGVAGDADGDFPDTLSARGSTGRGVRLFYTITAQRRGSRSIGPLSVVATDPFAFARRRHTIGRASALTVMPAIIALGPLTDRPGDAGGSTHAATDQLGQGTDNLIPRHYIPGDSTRRIHWRASAHRDELMVRQEEQETMPEAVVVLDCGAARWAAGAARAAGADPRFELAVSACVSATAQLVHDGYVVSVFDADGTALAGPIEGGDTAGVEQLAIEFATIRAHRPDRVQSPVAVPTGEVTGPLVYITGAIDESDALRLSPLAHRSSLPVLLAVTDPGDTLAGARTAGGWEFAAISSDVELAGAWAAAADRGTHHART